jgi:hypothetical protein
MKTILLALSLLAMSAMRAAEPVNVDDFTNDKLLALAEQEVSVMRSDQLDAFIEYISYCRAVNDPITKGTPCMVASIRSEIKNDQAKAITRIAHASASQLYSAWGPYNKSTGKVRAKLRAELDRYLYVFEIFQSAAAARYSQLQVAPAR